MNIYYHDKYNYRLGLLANLHPFDGCKFERVFNEVRNLDGITFSSPSKPIEQQEIDGFVNPLIKRHLKSKKLLCRALEVPPIPFVPFSFFENKVLTPMKWAVAGTLEASEKALKGENCWNLSGGYHHASPDSIEGFCIYNDIGIAYQSLIKSGKLNSDDKILIIDTDAHHGNGNAITFENNSSVTLLDVYNKDIYPMSASTRDRINIPITLPTGVSGDEYLNRYKTALDSLTGNFRLAFVVAGTDVLDIDPLGGMNLSISNIANREKMTSDKLKALGIPFVMLGGGGYSKRSADAIVAGIKALAQD